MYIIATWIPKKVSYLFTITIVLPGAHLIHLCREGQMWVKKPCPRISNPSKDRTQIISFECQEPSLNILVRLNVKISSWY